MDESLKKAKDLIAKAKPGPYRFELGNELSVTACGDSLGGINDEATYSVIEFAANALAEFVAEIEELRRLRDANDANDANAGAHAGTSQP